MKRGVRRCCAVAALAACALALAAGSGAVGMGASVTQDPFDRTAGLIGLLPLPEVFGETVCAPFEPRAIPLSADATVSERAGELRVTSPGKFPPEGECEGLEVRVFQGEAPPTELPTELPTLE